jgi:hypothetical protein
MSGGGWGPYTLPLGAPAETMSAEQISYATPAPRTGARVWAGAAIVLAGLGLIVLGGCFLIGVMLVTTNGFTVAGGPPALPARAVMLLAVLYTLAFGSFVAAVWLLVMGVRGLYAVLRG